MMDDNKYLDFSKGFPGHKNNIRLLPLIQTCKLPNNRYFIMDYTSILNVKNITDSSRCIMSKMMENMNSMMRSINRKNRINKIFCE